MKKIKPYIINVIYLVIGTFLIVVGAFMGLDTFWSGMGSALLAIGAIRLIRSYRINKNEEYREQVEIENSDERNRFLRNKAWAWAGYIFVLIMSVTVIVCKVMGNDIAAIAASGTVLLMMTLFWVIYLILKRKY